MPRYLDVATWSRRETFNFFINFDKPYFNICTSLDITNLLSFLRERPGFSASLAYHYFALRVANQIEPFRYRLQGGKVVVYDVINGGTTVLLPNDSFVLAYFKYDPDFDSFMTGAQQGVAAAKSAGTFEPRPEDDAIHFTTLPWVAFSSFSHARNWGREDSVPKIAFGKFVHQNDRVLLPVSVEVHHALVDGVHVGRFIVELEKALLDPVNYLKNS